MNAKTVSQIMILCTGVPAALLSQMVDPDVTKWACIFGLLGQPFWLYSARKQGQFGMYGISVLYMLVWAIGLVNYWIAPAWRHL